MAINEKELLSRLSRLEEQVGLLSQGVIGKNPRIVNTGEVKLICYHGDNYVGHNSNIALTDKGDILELNLITWGGIPRDKDAEEEPALVALAEIAEVEVPKGINCAKLAGKIIKEKGIGDYCIVKGNMLTLKNIYGLKPIDIASLMRPFTVKPDKVGFDPIPDLSGMSGQEKWDAFWKWYNSLHIIKKK